MRHTRRSKARASRFDAWRSSCAVGLAAASVASANPAIAADTTDTLDEVIVTARRTQEAARSTPIALEVVSGAEIADGGVGDLQDVSSRVASLQTSQVSRDEVIVNIRGQGPGVGAFPGVVTYLNEAPFRGLGQGQMFDLASVQVLKGPQGTLFGRNSNGGAILLTSRPAEDEVSAYLRAEAGDYGSRGYQAAVNAPLVDGVLALRLAAMSERREGFTRVAGSDLRLDDRDVAAARLSIRWTPSSSLRNDLVVDGSRVETSGTSGILTALNPIGPLALLPPETGVAQAAFGLLAQQKALGPRTQAGLSVDPLMRVEHWGVMDRFEARLSDRMVFTNIASFRRYQRLQRSDYDGTPLPLLDFAITPDGWDADQTSVTEEAQLRAEAGDVAYTVGAFYQDDSADDGQRQVGVIFFQPILRIDQAQDRSQALYGEVRWDADALVPGLQLSAGYRHTWDRRRQTAATVNLVTGACSGAGATPPGCTLQDEAEFDAGNWSLAGTWELTPDVTAYATARRGYKSGGLNLGQPFADRRRYEPEYLTDVEIGLKGRAQLASDITLTYAIDAYRGDYRDVQINALVADGAAIYNIVENGAEATIQGIDVDGVLAMGPVALRLAYAYTDAAYDTYSSAIYGDLSDSPWPYTSRNKGVVGVDWRLPEWRSVAQPVASLSYAFQSGSTFGYEIDPETHEPGYGLLDVLVELRNLAGRPVDLAFFATNVTDEVYRTGVIGLYNTLGLDTSVYGEPRMIGARLTARFGADAAR
ncbi:TonB-dependent receptor [Brevundimonas sp. Leaf363]|uniref:TonB-dependent receptor n=1 Tax=Brevundimonas sp. Leaf363 TaxID=1736353 RepID=UPI00138F6F3A|nr:TonB-dependent receptor [Brevundimonas sp. Leaf363]